MNKLMFTSLLIISPLLMIGQSNTKVSDNSSQVNNPQSYNQPFNSQTFSTGCEYYEQLGNNFENGKISNTIFPLLCADDVTVNANECWNIEAVEVPFFTNNPTDASQINVYFFEDNFGQPGNIFASQTISPSNWTTSLIGNNFGLNVHLFEIDLNSSINLCGGATGTTFWFSVQVVNTLSAGDFFWVFSTNQPYGSNGYTAPNTSGPWTLEGDNYEFKLLIEDTEAPIPDLATLTDVVEQCEATALTAPTATDNCDGSITGTHNATLPITSSTTITWTYEDNSGNSVTQNQEVIIDDTENPVPDAATLTDVVEQCEATALTAPTATDNCDGSIIGTHNATLPITSSTTITWTYEDNSGNSVTQNQEVFIQGINTAISEEDFILTAENDNTGVTYQWVDCSNDYATILGETNQTFEPSENGVYAAIIIEGNCEDTTECITISTIGIPDLFSSFGVHIYPNPTNGVFTIESDLVGERYIVIDAQGRKIIESVITNSKTIVDLSNVNTGIYYVTIREFSIKLSKN
jgi:hypothetical protein